MPLRELAIEVLDADLEDGRHAAGTLAILDSYARDPIGGGHPLAPEVRERLIPELRAQGNARVLLAFADGRPIGVAVCFVGFSTFAARPLLNIHDLAVLPEYRGRGVGRALLAEAEFRAREIGCCKLTLEVRGDNDRAQALYRSFGFRAFVPGDDPNPTFFLQKPL